MDLHFDRDPISNSHGHYRGRTPGYASEFLAEVKKQNRYLRDVHWQAEEKESATTTTVYALRFLHIAPSFPTLPNGSGSLKILPLWPRAAAQFYFFALKVLQPNSTNLRWITGAAGKSQVAGSGTAL